MSQIFEANLFEFLKIPSVSAQSKHEGDCRAAAKFVHEQLVNRGFKTEIMETGAKGKSFPVVLGHWSPPKVNQNTKTLLVYGHYDVQPPEPFELWESKPFEPTVRDGKVYARGATDNKGQVFALICGIGQAIKETPEALPKIIMLIEGEEEIGSPNLEPFIEKHESQLACDTVLISDSPQLGPNQPAICYGLKGLTYFELNIRSTKRDLHSGSFGGLVQNPAIALAQILGKITDKNGKVTIPGFYDAVLPLEEKERQMISTLPFDENALKTDLGCTNFFGEGDYTPLERRFARPTFDIHGIKTGYQDEGAKTVIPAEAMAKFGFRLVANQEPEKIEEKLNAFLKHAFEQSPYQGLKWKLKSFHSAHTVHIDINHPIMPLASEAIEAAFGKKPVFIREGGSIPVVSTFQKRLKALPLLIGLGLPTDGAHAPNEHFTLADFHRGIELAKVLPEKLNQVS